MANDPTETFDAIIIGSGQGGMPLSMALARAGRRTAIIEKAAVGGSCINYGCTPTKTLIHIGKVADTVRRAGRFGVRTSPPEIDMHKVRERKRRIVHEFSSGSEESLKKTPNLELIFGHGQFTGPREIEVRLREGGIRRLTAPWAFINTGTRAFIPPVPGLDSVRHLDNVSIMELDHLPARLTVLGGGYIGLEFGQLYARLGSKVTILEQSPRFLPHEDQDVADEVLKLLCEDGIEVCLGVSVKRAFERGSAVVLETGDREVEGDELLVAVGRSPNTGDLGLDRSGVEVDEKGYIRTDSRLRTSAEGVYVIGDAKGGPAFTHVSYDDFRILKANLLDGEDRTIENRLVPYVAFIDPELAHIGLSEEEAIRKGVAHRVIKMSMTRVARADEMDETRGFIKALIDPGTGKILGATVIGVWGGEIMSMIELAMVGGLIARDLNNLVFAHPTLLELLNNLFEL